MKKRQSSFIVSATVAGIAALALVGCNRDTDTTATGAGTGTTVGTQIDDTALTSSVKSALMADDTVRSFDIDVETRNGEVSLNGQVESQTQIDQAVSVARNVSGVRDVNSNLTLRSAGTAGTMGMGTGTATGSGDSATLGQAADDTAVTARVKSALLAESQVSGFAISVETTNGVVQLTGEVDNQAQVDRAVQIASSAEGARSVQNQLRVKP
jgi:hyperosmotically inducible periplasmic protein